MPTSKAEMETIILFNEEEDTASIYTHNVKLMNRCARFVQANPTLAKREGRHLFTVPKKLLTIVLRSPMTPAEQQRMAEHSKRYGFQPGHKTRRAR